MVRADRQAAHRRSALNARQMLLVNMLTDALPAAALAVSADPNRRRSTATRPDVARDRDPRRGDHRRCHAGMADGARIGTPRRAATVALIGLVGTQLVQTLVDSHGRAVVLTSLGDSR